MPTLSRSSAFARVTALAAQRPVHSAFAWLHRNPKRIMDWQAEMVAIPAPPYGEAARAAWLAERFGEAGLSRVEIDGAGNVFGTMAAAALPSESTGPVVLLSAHIDTVFPASTPLRPVVDGDRLTAPGACDNGAGVAGMLALVHALQHAKVELPAPLIFIGNVGEEGEGDLRGVRHIYSQSPLSSRIAAHIILDGAGADTAVVQALGSRRHKVTISGPGGHSFTDAGTPNPIVALASALAKLAGAPLDAEARTTLNVGTIRGGTSVNSIPENAEATVDFRSTDTDELVRLDVALHRAVEDSVTHWNALAKASAPGSRGHLRFSIGKIGERPTGHLPAGSPLRETLQAVDRHLGLRADLRLGSTDANLPLSLGIPAISMGAGGEGGGAHTIGEWYSARDRETGLRRVLLLTLAMLGWAAEQ
jgi:tripeptide aminopeptidase